MTVQVSNKNDKPKKLPEIWKWKQDINTGIRFREAWDFSTVTLYVKANRLIFTNILKKLI